MQNYANRSVRWLVVIVNFFGMMAVLAGTLPAAHAQENAQFGISPANPGANSSTSNYFTLKGQPGQTIRDAVKVSNPGNVSVKLKVYATDASTSQQSGAVYSNSTEANKLVGSWITLENSEIELAPKKQQTINFTVIIPKEMSAGQHLGGIAVQPIQAASGTASSGASFGITTVSRALTAVLINVGDAANKPLLQINGAQIAEVDGLPTLTLTLQNSGNALIKPKGEVTLLDTASKTVLDTKLTLDTLVPQTTIAYPVQADPPTQPGTYKVHASLDFGGSTPAIFDGEVVVQVPVATTSQAVTGRTRLTPAPVNPIVAAIGAAQQASNQAPAQAQADNGVSGMVIGLIAVCTVLMLTTLGLGLLVLRRRKTSPNK